jgi:hypothetical protein
VTRAPLSVEITPDGNRRNGHDFDELDHLEGLEPDTRDRTTRDDDRGGNPRRPAGLVVAVPLADVDLTVRSGKDSQQIG